MDTIRAIPTGPDKTLWWLDCTLCGPLGLSTTDDAPHLMFHHSLTHEEDTHDL